MAQLDVMISFFLLFNLLIILDNASCHRTEVVKDLIQLNNNLLYIVPYQHETQAIEGFFNVLKSRLKQKSSDLRSNRDYKFKLIT